MAQIKVNVSYSERFNTLYWRKFDIVERLPLIGEERVNADYRTVVRGIVKSDIDTCNRDEAYAYDYYVVTEELYERAEDGEGWDFVEEEHSYIAIHKEIDEDEEIEEC